MTEDIIPYIVEGVVVDTNDPDQMGKLKIWIPSLDGENYDLENLPWADYASPIAGFTVDYPGGTNEIQNESHSAYGFWAIPKLGATVLVFFLYGDISSRFYFASTIRLHKNISLPAGRNHDDNGNAGPFGDAVDDKNKLIAIQPAYFNLREQFQNKLTESEAQTRGAFERQVAQGKFEKDGKEGYSPNAADKSYLDSQTYCFVTPGRHSLIFQDDPEFARVRLKTSNGHQIILDDANERIYISTAKGKSWVELDEDGHINVFGSDSISVRTGGDLNFFADKDINLQAEGSINTKAGKNTNVTSGKNTNIHSVSTTSISACSSLHIKSEGSLFATGDSTHILGLNALYLTSNNTDIKGSSAVTIDGGKLHLNGPSASTATEATCAEFAESPNIVPGHEPWKRPETKKKRNKYWKA